MNLSDAIERGAQVLKTPGPTWDCDCWHALDAGLTGQQPDETRIRLLYWENPWGVTPGSDLEMWLRGVVREGYHWSAVIKKLRLWGA